MREQIAEADNKGHAPTLDVVAVANDGLRCNLDITFSHPCANTALANLSNMHNGVAARLAQKNKKAIWGGMKQNPLEQKELIK